MTTGEGKLVNRVVGDPDDGLDTAGLDRYRQVAGGRGGERNDLGLAKKLPTP